MERGTQLFAALGFRWNRAVFERTADEPAHSVKVCVLDFNRRLPEYVWSTGVLEGNPHTFPEVKTLLDGITTGGRKIADQLQILRIAQAAKELGSLVASGSFALTKAVSDRLHDVLMREDALESGHFRGEGAERNYTPHVGLGDRGEYRPSPTKPGATELNRRFREGTDVLANCPPLERGIAYSLFGALHQFYFDGNKRTARNMMNGVLMTNGILSIGIPAARALEYNTKMRDFYLSQNASQMIDFMLSCREVPQHTRNRELGPGKRSGGPDSDGGL
jgi:Fic family protein